MRISVGILSYTYHINAKKKRSTSKYYWIEVQQIMQEQQSTLTKKGNNMEEDIPMDTAQNEDIKMNREDDPIKEDTLEEPSTKNKKIDHEARQEIHKLQ
jgi:hypothetical protein